MTCRTLVATNRQKPLPQLLRETESMVTEIDAQPYDKDKLIGEFQQSLSYIYVQIKDYKGPREEKEGYLEKFRELKGHELRILGVERYVGFGR